MDNLSPEQFRDALRKGLGRAVRHVRSSPPEAVRSDLAYACTRFLGLNLQEEEGGRVPWLWSMIEATGEPDFYRRKVIAAIDQMPDSPDDAETFNELYAMLAEFAGRGDEESLAVMWRRFETANVPYEPHFGFHDLFRIEGIDALIRFLRREWNRIRDDETLWVSNDEIKYAEEKLGKETVQAALKKESLANESVRLYLERLDRQEQARQAEKAERRKTKQEPSPLPRLAELIDDLDNDWPQEAVDWTDDVFRATFLRRRNRFLHSGRFYAKPTPEELEDAFRELMATDDPGRQFCLLAVFVRKPMPRVEPELLSLLDAPFHNLRWGAEQAFCLLTDPMVRAKGLELIAKAPDFADWHLGIALLQKNYQSEDESLLQKTLESIPTDTDAHELHAVITSLLDLTAANGDFTFGPLLLWCYENSPCPYCRCKSVEQMIQRNIASQSLLEECLDDSFERTGELARSVLFDVTNSPI